MKSFCVFLTSVVLLLFMNINLSAQCSGPLTILPVTDDFESYTTGTVTFNEFQNAPTGDIDWRVHTGATGSTNTGPTGDVSGTGNYIYMEASAPAIGGDKAILTSDCLDLNNSVNPVLEFYYHLYGSSIKSFDVNIDVNGVQTSLLNFTGQQQATNTDPWKKATINLAPYIGNSVQVVFVGELQIDSSGFTFNGDMSLDEIAITDPLPMDIGVETVDQPQSACQLSNAEIITVTIENYGSSAESNFPISYTINGGTPVTETFTGTLAPTATATYSFTTTADLSAFGTTTINTYTSLMMDSNVANDSASTTLITGGASLPFLENYDSYPDGTVIFPNFVNSQNDQLEWEVNIGTTSSIATGPDDDVSIGGGYIYTETSGSGLGDSAIICTECIDLSGLMNPRLEFSYHMFGGSIDRLEVLVNNGTNSTVVFGLPGQQQTANNDPWKTASVNLGAYVGQVVSLCFKGVVRADQDGFFFNGDMAIDEVTIIDPLPNDIGVTNITSPSPACILSNSEVITAEITNFGSTNETGFDVTYALNGPNGPVNVTENVGALVLNSGATINYNFTATADMSALGLYSIDAWTSLTTDSDVSNDSSSVTVQTGGSILPQTENFDAYQDGTIVFPELFNDQTDQLEWEVNFGPTLSTATGPDDDLTIGGGYIYIETSGSALGDEASISTGCIDLTNGVNPKLEFYYHMYGGSIDTLEVSVTNGATTTVEGVLVNQQQSTNSDPWKMSSINLTSYVGSVIQINFRGKVKADVSGFFFNGDMALDNIAILDPLPNDLGVSKLISPLSTCQLSSSEIVTVEISNYGNTPETGFDVTYQLNGPTGLVTQTENVGALSLPAGAIDTYSFATPVDLSALGTYSMNVWTDLTGDNNLPNDSTGVITILTGGQTMPVNDNFDTYPDGATTFSNLFNQTNDDLDWEVNIGPTGSSGTGPDDDVSFGGGYIYIESSGATDGDKAIICTDCINLTAAVAPQLEYSYHMFGSSIDRLDIFLETGGSVFHIDSLIGQQQSGNADFWIPKIIDLTSFVGSVVSVCFEGTIQADSTGTTFRGDMALDNIIIREPPPCPDPYLLTAINVQDVQADISWVSGGNAIDAIIVYGPPGFVPGTPGNGEVIVSPATNPQTITGLSPLTTYDFYVTENCGPTDGMSLTIGPRNFTTACAPFPTAGNYFWNPIPVNTFPFSDVGNTGTCYLNDFSFAGTESPDVFYNIIPDSCANEITVSLCNSNFDTRLILVNAADSSVLATNDDFCGLQSEITFAITNPGPILAVVEGFGTASTGNYAIDVTQVISTSFDSITIAGNRLSCPGNADGSVFVQTYGGAFPRTFQWSNGATGRHISGLSPGTYTLTVADNCGGFEVDSFKVEDALMPVVNSGGSSTSICIGSAVQLGGSPTVNLGLDTLFTAFGFEFSNGEFFNHTLATPTLTSSLITDLTGAYLAGDFGPGGFFALNSTTEQLVKLDTVTGIEAIVGPVAVPTGHTITGLAWDATTAKMYMVTTDATNSELHEIDYNTGAVLSSIPMNARIPIWLAIDNYGAAYTLEIDGDTIKTVDLTTGVTTQLPDAIGFDANFAQDADFDPFTNELYLAAFNNDIGAPELRKADLTTGTTTLVGPLTTGQVTAYGIIGPPVYTFSWTPTTALDDPTSPNPVADPTVTTTYVLEVLDFCGVVATSATEVVVNPLPLADAGMDVNQCSNEFTILTASGGNIYSWSTGEQGATIVVNPDTTTTYYVTVTDNLCSASDSVTVTPVTTVEPMVTILTGTVLESTPAATYQWYFDNMIIPGATMQTYTPSQNGVYWVETTDFNGCSADSYGDSIFVEWVNVLEIISIETFEAYPNPVTNDLNINIVSAVRDEYTLRIVDVVGRTIYSNEIEINDSYTTNIDFEQFPSGMYIVQLFNDTGALQKRIIKSND